MNALGIPGDHNNFFCVTAEFEVERKGSYETRRPDGVCFVNGISLVVIGCKRPVEKDATDAAINQTLRSQEEDQIPYLLRMHNSCWPWLDGFSVREGVIGGAQSACANPY